MHESNTCDDPYNYIYGGFGVLLIIIMIPKKE